MPPALSADPISPSAIERPWRPPNQQSLTREDKGVHCFSLETLIVYIASIFQQPTLGIAKRRACRTDRIAQRRHSAARLGGLRGRQAFWSIFPPRTPIRRGPFSFFFLRLASLGGGGRRRRRGLVLVRPLSLP